MAPQITAIKDAKNAKTAISGPHTCADLFHQRRRRAKSLFSLALVLGSEKIIPSASNATPDIATKDSLRFLSLLLAAPPGAEDVGATALGFTG
mmetsp:Transcript_25301/g.39687  ORF Transcript_25301/g.39687 Transcript_25301/m.39687 type:complete len:93 (-) Transcript_25301:107-385(-)